MLLYNAFYLFFFLMAPDFLALATTLENLGARRLLAKKVNFVPWLGLTIPVVLEVSGKFRIQWSLITNYYYLYTVCILVVCAVT